MGILSGLSEIGNGKIDSGDIYKKDDRSSLAKAIQPDVKKDTVATESEYTFEKSYECPCCSKQFKEMTVKTAKARLVKTDRDLRPVFNGIDPLKYDVISCPSCGYSATSKFYGVLAAPQKKLIVENISRNFKRFERNKIVSYDEALERYKLALANSIVKKGKDSEKAYTCLRMGWVVRGKYETLNKDIPDYDRIYAELLEDENELLHNALEGFVSARRTEHFPIAGMDELTLDYLLSVLFYKEGDIDNCAKLLASILTSKTANARIKEKAREIKDEILEQRKKNQ